MEKNNHIGERYGRLTVIGVTYKKYKTANLKRYVCKCECGGQTITALAKLKSGHTQSCGCLQRERTSKASLKSLVGRHFGRLTVIERCGNKYGRTAYKCLCNCGKTVEVSAINLVEGKQKSCGCFASDLITQKNTTHGKSKSRIYTTWNNMRERCSNPNSISYNAYGARGISVCQEWKTFEKFYEWATSHRYKEGLTIDRIDNDKGYCPENCQWISRIDNIIKQRKTVLLTCCNLVKSVTGWAKFLNISIYKLRKYYKNNGKYDTEKFLYEELKKHGVLPLIEQNN